MTTQILRRNTRLLIINPNSSQDMTHGMERAIRSINLPNSLEIILYTAPPESPASIDNDKDIELSTDVVLKHLLSPPSSSESSSSTTIGGGGGGLLSTTTTTTNNSQNFDGILVACYSAHTLVPALAERCPHLAVTGIFEASVVACLPLLSQEGEWGIVTTGAFWEAHLRGAVKRFLGQPSGQPNFNFSGVFSTGLTAGDFHGGNVTPEVVRAKMKEATQALLREGRVECVVMGCAGMAGLEDIIRSAIKEEYKPDTADRVHVVDGVRAGVGVLKQMVQNKRMFLAN